jgi:predicted CopG family antitoxin
MYIRRKLTTISISYGNYLTLKKLGSTGDSFNDVLTELLKKVRSPLQIDGVGRSDSQLAVDDSAQTTIEDGGADGYYYTKHQY